MASALPRRQWLYQATAAIVRLLQTFPATREGSDPLLAILRSFLDAQVRACRPAEEEGIFGFHWFCRRWGEGSVALRAEREVLVDCWESGEGFWKLELGRGGLWRMFAGVVISGQK